MQALLESLYLHFLQLHQLFLVKKDVVLSEIVRICVMLQNHLNDMVFIGSCLVGEVTVDADCLREGCFGLCVQTCAVQGRHSSFIGVIAQVCLFGRVESRPVLYLFLHALEGSLLDSFHKSR